MTLSREEIQAHNNAAFVALVERERCPVGADYVSWLNGLCVGWRGALALTPPTVAPVAPPAGKYEPKVGDVVRIGAGDYPYECVLVDFTNHDEIRKAWVLKCGHGLSTPRFDSWSGYWPDPVYLRPATASELAAAGLAVPPPAPTPAPEGSTSDHPATNDYGQPVRVGTSTGTTPAPEAKRPEWVRVVKSASPYYIQAGQVLRVRHWEDGDPCVEHDEFPNAGYRLTDTSWEPAPCPPPVAGSARYDVLAIKNAILRECPYDVRRKDLEDYHAMAIAKAVIAALPEVKS